MPRARIGRAPLFAAVFLIGSTSAVQGQFGPPDLVPPTHLPPAPPGVPTVVPVADASTAKPGDVTKFYEPCLTCDRPVKYGGVRCNKHKGCFQKKTIFEWSIGCDPMKNGDEKSGNGEDDPASEPGEEDRLTSDRPDFTEASSTVGRGRIQLESGYTYFGDKTGGTRTRTHSYPEALLRVGLFADWFELRVGQTVFSQSVRGGAASAGPTPGQTLPVQAGGADPGPTNTRDTGLSDLYLGAKLALTEQKGVLPETALILQGTVPTGANAFTANRVLYGFNYLFGWDVTDTVSVGGSFQGNKAVDDDGRSYALFAQSLTIGYKLAKNLTGYTEWFALYPTGADATGGGAQHFLDGGFQYFVTKNFALDVRVGVGLTRSADDFFVGTGFVVRY